MFTSSTVATESSLRMVTLHDGRQVHMRPITPEDAPGLQDLFRRLSPESIFLRFLGERKNLTDEKAKRLVNAVFHERMAYVATNGQNKGNDIIAVAQYATSNPSETDIAEVAIVVKDKFQPQGLCTLLLKQLANHALAHGIHTFTAVVHSTNSKILRFIKCCGLLFRRELVDRNLWEYKVELEFAIKS